MVTICQDAAFKAFCSLMNQTRSAHTWELVLRNQAYPNPRELLCDNSFYVAIAKTEPGVHIDHQKIRHASIQLGSTPDQRLRIAKLCNDLNNSHRGYVQARACVEGHNLYGKMIDRFYGKIADHDFQRFVANNANNLGPSVWPEYEAIKQANDIKLNNWLRELQRCTTVVHEIKNFVLTKNFLRQVETIHQARRRQSKDLPTAPTATSKPPLTLAERKRAIERRNRIHQRARQRANEGLRLQNKQNVHQIGEQGRHPNPEPINALIAQMQKDFKERQTEVTSGDLYWYKKMLEESGMKAAMVELALEETKAALEADRRIDMSKRLVLAEGLTNIANAGSEHEEDGEGGQ